MYRCIVTLHISVSVHSEELHSFDSMSAHDFLYFLSVFCSPSGLEVKLLYNGLHTKRNDLCLFDSITYIVKKYHIVYFSRTYKFL